MPDPKESSIGLNIPSNLLPWILAGTFGLGSGGVGAEFLDVLGAKEWKEAHAEQLKEFDAVTRDRDSCRAQKVQLLDLLDGATLRTEAGG